MTAKYTAAKGLAAKSGEVTIKGNSALGIPDQSVAGSTIVSTMETTITIGADHSKLGKPNTVASVDGNPQGLPASGPITYYKDGSASSNSAQLFGHEILHKIYSGVGLPNRGWANGEYNEQHQVPFDEASNEIK